MKNLIFTADDYGAYEEIDNGVLKALENGWINSVAMLANGYDMQRSADRILPFQEDKRVHIGCHFTINSGRALSPEMRKNNAFTQDGHFRPYFNMNIVQILKKEHLSKNMADLQCEIRAQIDLLEGLGIKVKHLSSHFNTLHFYEKMTNASFQLLDFKDYRGVKLRSTYIEPEISKTTLLTGAFLGSTGPNKINIPKSKGKLIGEDYVQEFINNRKEISEKYEKVYRDPPMPYILDGFHYQKIGSLGLGRSTKKRKAKRKAIKIHNKVQETIGSDKIYEFLFHLADPDLMRKETQSRKAYKHELESKYYGVTPKYMDNRHVEYLSLEHFYNNFNLELDPQPWSKI